MTLMRCSFSPSQAGVIEQANRVLALTAASWQKTWILDSGANIYVIDPESPFFLAYLDEGATSVRVANGEVPMRKCLMIHPLEERVSRASPESAASSAC